MTNITIPKSVTSIGNGAFSNCNSLTSVVFEDTSNWYATRNYENYINKEEGEYIDVTNGSVNATYFTNMYYDYYWYKPNGIKFEQILKEIAEKIFNEILK